MELKEILVKLKVLKEEKLKELGLKDIPKGEHGNLKYLDTVAAGNNLNKMEAFFNNVYRGSKDDVILDFGTGTGRLLWVARQIGFTNIIGLDIDQEKLFGDNIFMQFHKLYKLNDIIFYDGLDIPFTTNTFDSIIYFTTLVADFTKTNKMYYRIKQLINITKSNGIWHVAPEKDIRAIKEVFSTYNNKNIVLVHAKLY